MALLACATAATACVDDTDYAGDYDMTYQVLVKTQATAAVDARAGTAAVHVEPALEGDYVLDLGPSFCLVEGRYVAPDDKSDVGPHLDIRPQLCWFQGDGASLQMQVTGTAAFLDDGRFAISLAGNVMDPKLRASATVALDEAP